MFSGRIPGIHLQADKMFNNPAINRFLTAFTLAMGITVASAQEYVGGVLTGSTVYSPALNPIIVVEPLIVPANVVLTIEPGTRLYFMIGSSLRTEGGELIARGTPEQPISFLPQTDNKWDGISFSGSETGLDENGNYLSGSILEYISISQTTTGLKLSDTSHILARQINITVSDFGITLQSGSSLQLFHSTVDQCSYGMYIKDSDDNIIDNCTITNCDIGVFYPSNSNSNYNRLSNNNLSYHRNIALFMSIGQGHIQYNEIHGNTVTHNNIGLHIGNGGQADQGFNVISSNIVQFNDIGIKLSQDADTLRNNLVAGNVTGMLISKAGYNVIESNIVKDNTGWGMHLTDASQENRISANTVTGNAHGVLVTHKDFKYSVNNTFEYNLLSGNLNETFLFEAGPQHPLRFNSILGPPDTHIFVNHFETDIYAQNNWWGTTDTTGIDSLIYDFHDNEIYGEVVYKPFSETPDPQSPLSKPALVVKRRAGNHILVDWKPNSESDIAGYRVYFGEEGSEGFSGSIDVGSDTTCILENLALADPVAVTAYDTDADGSWDQTEGHESDYSYAIAGPYSGTDTIVCQGSSYNIADATSLYIDNVEWTTSGDGIFSDATEINPVYTPGSEDIANGSVDLTLLQTAEGLQLSDGFTLNINGVPFLYAGNDTTVFRHEAYTALTASAENFTRVNWETMGDGVFSDPGLLNCLYQPGDNDILNGGVQLIVNLESACGSLRDTLLLGIIPSYSIHGSIRMNNNQIADAVVVAVRDGTSGFRAVEATSSDAAGKFLFENLASGNYYLYALSDPENFPQRLPTYYAMSPRWQKAHLLPVETDVFDVDIELLPVDTQIPAGAGSISGFFNYLGDGGDDDKLYTQAWFGKQENLPGGNSAIPAANHIVLLMNAGFTRIFGWALTASDGSFSFNNLPFGSYRLWGEKAGYTNSTFPLIVLSDENKDVEGVLIILNQKNIEITVPENELPGSVKGLVYPNPASGKIRLNPSFISPDESFELSVYSAEGVLAGRISSLSGLPEGTGEIDISGFKPGIYMVVLNRSTGETSTQKLVVAGER